MLKIAEAVYSLEDRRSVAGMRVDLRTTIVKLRDGSLWVHSPTQLYESVRERVDALGEVRYLVAASNGHNQWLCEWQDTYPDSATYVAAGIPKKLPKLKNYKLLEDEEQPPWAEDLDQAFMGVAFFGEFVFLHLASRSLIVTDFVQNHAGEPQRGFGVVMRKLFFEPMGFKGVCLPPPLKRRMVVKDPKALRAFIDRVLGWDFDRIVVAHGPVIDEAPKEVLASLVPKLPI